MSGNARQVAPFGPAPVAVHDDGDVFGEPCRIEMPVDFGFLVVEPGGYFVVQSGHPDMRLTQRGRGCNDTGEAAITWRGHSPAASQGRLCPREAGIWLGASLPGQPRAAVPTWWLAAGLLARG